MNAEGRHTERANTRWSARKGAVTLYSRRVETVRLLLHLGQDGLGALYVGQAARHLGLERRGSRKSPRNSILGGFFETRGNGSTTGRYRVGGGRRDGRAHLRLTTSLRDGTSSEAGAAALVVHHEDLEVGVGVATFVVSARFGLKVHVGDLHEQLCVYRVQEPFSGARHLPHARGPLLHQQRA